MIWSRLSLQNNIEVIPIPGACAAINALIASGLSSKEFIFYGFLPLNNKLRDEKFEDISRQKKTIIIYEAPHRLLNTLQELKERLGSISIVVAKEITKIHEEFIRGNIEEVLKKIDNPKGEYIILFEINGKSKKEEEDEKIKKMSIDEQYKLYINMGFEKKEAIKRIAKNVGARKDEIYKKFIN